MVNGQIGNFPTCSFFVLSWRWRRSGGCWLRLLFSTAFVDIAKCDPGVQHMKQGDLCKRKGQQGVTITQRTWLDTFGGRSSSFRLLFSRSWTITLVYLFLLEIQVGISGSQSPAAVQSGNWSEPWGQWWGSPVPPGTRDAPRSSTEYLWTCINQGWIPNGDNPHPHFLRFTAVNFTSVFGCWVQWVGRCLCSQGQNQDQSIPLA